VKIRESTERDKEAILRVHQNAFGEAEGETVSKLAIDLLKDMTALPLLSLVVEIDHEIVGHILFTSVNVDGSTITKAYILAPLAVTKKHQGVGIGKQLIKQGLQLLKERNASFVLVLGDPNYYAHSGFETVHKLSPPYELEYPEAWMAQELKSGALKSIEGTVQCASSLNLPEHW